MGWVLKWKFIVVCVMRDVCVVVHHQKLPKGNIAHQFFVLREMLYKQRQSKYFMHLRIGVDIEHEQRYGQKALHLFW